MKKRELSRLTSIEIIFSGGREIWYKIKEGSWKRVSDSIEVKEEALMLYINQLRKIEKKMVVRGKR